MFTMEKSGIANIIVICINKETWHGIKYIATQTCNTVISPTQGVPRPAQGVGKWTRVYEARLDLNSVCPAATFRSKLHHPSLNQIPKSQAQQQINASPVWIDPGYWLPRFHRCWLYLNTFDSLYASSRSTVTILWQLEQNHKRHKGSGHQVASHPAASKQIQIRGTAYSKHEEIHVHCASHDTCCNILPCNSSKSTPHRSISKYNTTNGHGFRQGGRGLALILSSFTLCWCWRFGPCPRVKNHLEAIGYYWTLGNDFRIARIKKIYYNNKCIKKI